MSARLPLGRPAVPPAVLAIAMLLCALGWWRHPTACLGAWLAVWWFWIGTALGGLANVWLHNLTGGQWGEAIRAPLLRFAGTIWIAALLFVPVLLGIHQLFPWALHADAGTARWSGELGTPGFKSAWLTPAFFVARSIAYLGIWSALAWLSRQPRFARSQPFSALALIVYGVTVGLAAVDWLMSLMPLWYSSVFGWLVGVGQMLAGLALGVVLAARVSQRPPASIFRDLGNLLLMYVMSWAYLAFSQFLIIWAEDLPHEIAWYLPRMHGPWLALAWLLALWLFWAPLLILLSRHAKQTPRLMAWLAAALLVAQLLNTCWLILPSLPVAAGHWLWALPLTTATLAAIVWLLWQHWPQALATEAAETAGGGHA
jgi:hypothetical protein